MFSIVIISCTILALFISLFIIITKKDTSSQIKNAFICLLSIILIWEIGILLRIVIGYNSDIPLTVFDGIAYIGPCFSPILIYFLSRIFINSKIKYSKKDLLFFMVPIITLIMFYTNDYHQLFYTHYSRTLITYNIYYYIHTIYTYSLLAIGLFSLLKYYVKNSGFFSKASICICLAIIIPVVLSITITDAEIYFYVIPSSFSISTFLLMFALLKFKLLNIAPIALQKIVDRISDGYIVVNEELKIVDYNKTLLEMLNLDNIPLRNKELSHISETFPNGEQAYIDVLIKAIQDTKNNTETVTLERHFTKTDKYFNIEINSILSRRAYIGSLILFKDITQHMKDQEIMTRQAQFAAFGEAAGRVAHDINSPSMAVKAEVFNIKDIIKNTPIISDDEKGQGIKEEILSSIHNVEIGMEKIGRITNSLKLKMQNTGNRESKIFNLNNLVNSIQDLMGSALRNANCTVNVDIPKEIEVFGEENKLDRVITNMIQNSVDAYKGNNSYGSINISANILKEDNIDNCIIEIEDKAGRNIR